MGKNRYKKLALLYLLSTVLLSGCNKVDDKQAYNNINIETTTETITEEAIYNETIAKIYVDYKEKSNRNIKIDDLIIESYDNPKYVWNENGVNYIYDYRINFNNNQELTYCDPGYGSKMYAVIVRNSDGTYEPIAALASIDQKIVNVKVTYLYDQNTYEPSKNYIIIDNPTKDDLNNIKNGDEYIKSENDNKLILTKNN